MNERERLQRVIDILASRMDDIFVGEYYAIRTDKTIEAAKEITAIFKQPQKDMRSRRERKLDEQFTVMGVKPRVYHFTKRAILRGAFNAITIATIEPKYKSITICIEKNTRLEIIEQATHLIEELNKRDVYGIAICDKSDRFSKRYGRMKAKGRLMQHLLKEQQK